MKKRTVVVILSVCLLLVSFCGCNNDVSNIDENSTHTTDGEHTDAADPIVTYKYTLEELAEMRDQNFSSSPFSAVAEGMDKMTDDEVRAIVLDLPADKYETYPNLHNVPLTATLYKGDEVIPIDLKDSKLIKLINFYNNSVYYHQYAYTQGLLDIDHLEKEVLKEDFRLVLTFKTKNNSTSSSYDTNIQAYDTIVVTNKEFVLLDHDLPGYEGQSDKYPYRAVSHIPLFNNYCWLDLFGF